MKRNQRSLVVDYDRPIRTLLRKILGDFGHVEIAERGVSGLMKYRDFIKATAPFHLVTLDMTLPQMDGVTMLECVRGHEMVHKVRPRSKILMLSGTDNRQAIIEALNMGANGYRLKPIERRPSKSKSASFWASQNRRPAREGRERLAASVSQGQGQQQRITPTGADQTVPGQGQGRRLRGSTAATGWGRPKALVHPGETPHSSGDILRGL